MSLKMDTSQFQAAMREAIAVSKRTIPEVINGHAYFVAKGAIENTQKAEQGKIDADLAKLFPGKRISNITVERHNAEGVSKAVPLVALMINARRGQLGKPGLYGDKMRKAIQGFKKAKHKTIAFLSSGWIPAVKAFDKYAKNKNSRGRLDKSVKQFSNSNYGSATPASQNTFVAIAKLENHAVAKAKKEGGFYKKVSRGFEIAVNNEVAEMKNHVAEQMAKAMKPFSVR